MHAQSREHVRSNLVALLAARLGRGSDALRRMPVAELLELARGEVVKQTREP